MVSANVTLDIRDEMMESWLFFLPSRASRLLTPLPYLPEPLELKGTSQARSQRRSVDA